MRLMSCFFAVAVTAMLTSSASAHSDVLVRADAGKVVIGAAEDLDAEEGGPFFDLDTNVFEGVLLNPGIATPPFFFDFERAEPGFFTSPSVPVGDNLPANTLLTLNPAGFSAGNGNDTVHYWDGTGAVNFTPLSSAQPGVTFEAGPDDPLQTDGVSFLDGHPIWGLDGGAADGVYLTGWNISVPGLETSDTFYLVWLANSNLVLEDDGEAVEAALEELEENGTPAIVGGIDYSFFEEAVEFAEGIPEPTSAVLAMLAMGAFAARRR